jgi:hypothetical protein
MKAKPLPLAMILSFLLCGLLPINCSSGAPEERIINDFESEDELDRLDWSCHTLYTLVPEHATHGSRSIKLELFPSEWPGISPRISRRNWSAYRELVFDVYNPGVNDVLLSVRIDDRPDYPEFPDRYTGRFPLAPGKSHIAVPLSSLATPSPARKLNLRNICRLVIFVSHPKEKVVLYLDHLKLQ